MNRFSQYLKTTCSIQSFCVVRSGTAPGEKRSVDSRVFLGLLKMFLISEFLMVLSLHSTGNGVPTENVQYIDTYMMLYHIF